MMYEIGYSEQRPWGSYLVVGKTADCVIKEIRVNKGEQLSLQRHQFRSEHWFIIKGTATVTLESVPDVLTEITLGPGESIDIGVGRKHRMSAHTEEVIFIEIQTGSQLLESDIERFHDNYGRLTKG